MKKDSEKVAAIIRDAGGKIVGRTRLQKTAYLLEAAGLGEGFQFDYYHYGPYSEDLARAASTADAKELIKEQEHPTSWGGFYSEYSCSEQASSPIDVRTQLAKEAAQADAVSLELAATAAFFAKRGNAEPWKETEQRKPDKAEGGHLDQAKELYAKLCSIAETLPKI